MRRPRRLTHSLFLLLLFLGAVPPRAGTASDLEAYRGWKVKTFDVTGLASGMATQIKRGLALTASGRLKNEKQVFFPETLEEDVQRTRLFLARRGYPYAQVAPEVNAQDPRALLVQVVLRVTPGPAVTAATVRVDSLPPELAEAARRALHIAPGDVLMDGDVETSTQDLTTLLQEHGYARAAVASDVEWIDSTRVHLLFRAHPGAAYAFGDVQVTGPSPDLLGVAQKTMGIQRGEPYTPAAMVEARENLRTLNLFQRTQLEIVDAGQDTLDVVATLVQRRPTYLQASLRYWSDDGLQGMARWTKWNCFGGGKGISFGASVSPYLQEVEGGTWWPAVTGPRTVGIVTLRAERESEDNYTSVSTGGALSLRYNRSFATHALIGLDVSDVQVTEKVLGTDSIPVQDGLLTALLLGASRRDTDDPISATHGYNAKAEIEWAPDALGSDNSYILAGASLAAYVPILARTQIAGRVTAAAGAPTSGSDVLLPNKRYYSGGDASHRGFDRRKLGPLDANGTPQGGEAKLETSLELRFPLFWKLRAAAFVDVGQVWPALDEFTWRSLEVAVGPGVWLQTPIGPIRADLGIRLTDYEPTQPDMVYHFSVGPAF